jgi:hypothetical protein
MFYNNSRSNDGWAIKACILYNSKTSFSTETQAQNSLCKMKNIKHKERKKAAQRVDFILNNASGRKLFSPLVHSLYDDGCPDERTVTFGGQG